MVSRATVAVKAGRRPGKQGRAWEKTGGAVRPTVLTTLDSGRVLVVAESLSRHRRQDLRTAVQSGDSLSATV
jgi:hypothetical protein